MTYAEYYEYYKSWSTESLIAEKNTIDNFIDEIDDNHPLALSAAWNAFKAITDILNHD